MSILFSLWNKIKLTSRRCLNRWYRFRSQLGRGLTYLEIVKRGCGLG